VPEKTRTSDVQIPQSDAKYVHHSLAEPDYAARYAKRKITVEPVFGQIKHNRGYRRFTRRGLSAVDSEWKLICTTANLLKIHRHRTATSG